MKSELEAKQEYIENFALIRPDLFFPESWSQAQKNEALELVRPGRIKSGMLTSIPMTCKAEQCPYASWCPLLKKNLAPKGYVCHPAGTSIKTYAHGDIFIEDLDPSIHRLYGYERKYNAVRSGRAGFEFDIATKHYCGFLVELSTLSGSHKVTHDHVSIVRFNENAIDKFCVYLMRKGDFWRIGKSQLVTLYKNTKHNHKLRMPVFTRGSGENADQMWILGIYNTNTEALLAEEYLSLQFQTSKTSFADSLKKIDSKHNGLYRWATKEQLLEHHKSLLKPEQFYRDMLDSFGLSIDYPIWKNGGFSDNEPELGPYVKHGMFIRSCNIIPGVMDVPVFSDERRTVGTKGIRSAKWEEVSVFKEPYCGTVYSLDVATHKTYFAGEIATHNCPIEASMVQEFFQDYIDEFQVDLDNLVEVSMIRDLVDQEIQYFRKTRILAQEHFIQEQAVGVDSDGEVVLRKELHQAVEYEDRILRRKQKLREAMLGTRESQAKNNKGSADTAVVIANLLEQVSRNQEAKRREMLQQLGVLEEDAYIKAHAPILDAEVVDG